MKPLCEVCKTHHDPHQAHVWPKVEKKVVFERVRKEVQKTTKPTAKRLVGVLVGFDKTKYQESYMRVWRALKSGRACPWPKV